MTNKVISTELYTKESEDSVEKTNLEILVPDPNDEEAALAISKNTLKDTNESAAQPD